ncbi:hypothetical protein HYPSUDRAFT_200549 [Hypholoma sublateritium FD-334 SS-4]|uniref:Uncharacterized protein n=1 Tax=Hypholoma sublateritium (strain FD-334 SS-4) TaxID=945553 RepID=A0A0D2LAR7_HYPSF|nr:hypothetical protein HYPSUDRAFT_200549 [Hypholoma sublateritium FD-334 SS-4]
MLSSSCQSQPSSHPAPVDNTPIDPAEIARLKRRLAAAQEEVKELSGTKLKKPPTPVTVGRGIRRLVSLYDSVDDIIQAADQQKDSNNDDDEAEEDDALVDKAAEGKREIESKLTAFTILIRNFPLVKEAIEDPNVDFDVFVTSLQIGANNARSDDVRRIKEAVAFWLNKEYGKEDDFEMLDPKERTGRGLHNYVTGRLLCPVDYDWDVPEIYTDIIEGTIDISEDYFLRCFYPNGNGDPSHYERGFLKSGLLVNVYKDIFTSPSSCDASLSASAPSEDVQNDSDGPAPPKRPKLTEHQARKKATKSCVATILGMEGRVTPRSIAYAAVLLAFNLTNAVQWVEIYNDFNFRALYNLIVDFFEVPGGKEAERRVARLLEWWNRSFLIASGLLPIPANPETS